MPDLVISHRTGRCATVTLNQPEKRNPISPAMRTALWRALESLRKDASVRSVILTGAGDSFCSGLDLRDLAALNVGKSPAKRRRDDLRDSKSIRDFFSYLLSYPKPTIAAVNGPAFAGGAGIALVCDVTVLSESASICFSEVRVGFVPAIISVHLQLSIGLKKARELMLSARIVSPQDALNLGIASAVVPHARLAVECAKQAAEFEKNGPKAMAATKRLLFACMEHNSYRSMNLSVSLNSRIRQSSECKEGVAAFLSKRPPSWCN